MLVKVQLPLAMPSIMAGINQALMLSLSMVVIASMIAVGGLGQMVLRGIGRLDMGLATVGGLGIVLLAITLDRITQAMGQPRRGAPLVADRTGRAAMSNQPLFTHGAKTAIAASLLALGLAGAAHAQNLPGKGVSVQPLKARLPKRPSRPCWSCARPGKLGYDVQPIKEVEPHRAPGHCQWRRHLHGRPLESAARRFLQKRGGDAKLYRKGVYSDNAAQGYLIDKKTADQYQITNIAQLKDPAIGQAV
jgi:hypothetical protein